MFCLQVFYQMCDLQTYSPSLQFDFSYFNTILWRTKVFNFDVNPTYIFESFVKKKKKFIVYNKEDRQFCRNFQNDEKFVRA